MPSKEEVISFSYQIEKIVKDKSVTYIEAMILYCEETGFEVELAAKMISGTLKSKIKMEAEELHFLPRSSNTKLPL